MLRRRFIGLIGTLAIASVLAFGGAPSYYPPSIGDYDGTNDYLERLSDLIGIAEGKKGIVSVWVRVDAGAGTNRYVYANQTNRHSLYLWGAQNKFVLVGYTNAGVPVLDLRSTSVVNVGTAWRHVLFSWDTGNGVAHCYIDDTEDLNTVTNDDGLIDYSRTIHHIGDGVASPWRWNGGIAEYYHNMSEYLDFSIESNRRKFIDASGYPVDLGPSGYKPTGTAPIVYMRTQYNNAGLNSGTGGDFVINGAPAYTTGPVPFPLTTWSPGGARDRGGRGGRAFMH